MRVGVAIGLHRRVRWRNVSERRGGSCRWVGVTGGQLSEGQLFLALDHANRLVFARLSRRKRSVCMVLVAGKAGSVGVCGANRLRGRRPSAHLGQLLRCERVGARKPLDGDHLVVGLADQPDGGCWPLAGSNPRLIGGAASDNLALFRDNPIPSVGWLGVGRRLLSARLSVCDSHNQRVRLGGWWWWQSNRGSEQERKLQWVRSTTCAGGRGFGFGSQVLSGVSGAAWCWWGAFG